jgi:molybdopterin converting factor small subunit
MDVTVTVLWFGPLRDHRGIASERVTVPEGTPLRALYGQLVPDLRLPVAFARNAQAVSGDEPVGDGDEVVFLPPVGGG